MAARETMLQSIYNHILLPPNLPGQQDWQFRKISRSMITRMIDASKTLRTVAQPPFSAALDSLQRSLECCFSLYEATHLDKAKLEQIFQKLQSDETLAIHIEEQNAGILIYTDTDGTASRVVFEAFELSPKSEEVLKYAAALQCTYPTAAASIPLDTFRDPSFCRHLAVFLEKAANESVKLFCGLTTKAHSQAVELRETADPALITSLLISILASIGQLEDPCPIYKRVRDEVRWENSEIPWRRSPLWLLLRIASERHLTRHLPKKAGTVLQKILLAVLHSNLLTECVGVLNPESSQLLLAKLCRRLAKIEKEFERILDGAEGLDKFFSLIRPRLESSARQASIQINNVLERYKRSITRFVPKFRTRRAGPGSTTLSLSNCLPYLENCIRVPPKRLGPPPAFVAPPQYKKFVARYSELAQLEIDIFTNYEYGSPSGIASCEGIAGSLGRLISQYLTKSALAYDLGTVERSRSILAVMWLWVILDEHLCTNHPPLTHFHPVFKAEMFDCILLVHREDIERMKTVQQHLKIRTANAQYSATIFSKTFAAMFMDHCPNFQDMTQLLNHIRAEAANQRLEKQREWQEKDARHQDLITRMAASTCSFSIEGDPPVLTHTADCYKCGLEDEASSVTILRHEEPLPPSELDAKAVVFELLLPEFLSRYRQTVWEIITSLGLPSTSSEGPTPRSSVRDYYQERRFLCGQWNRADTTRCITLRSVTKSFLETHLRKISFPTDFARVCVPNGLRFEYYDDRSGLWPASHLKHVTFHHHAALALPKQSLLSAAPWPSRAQMKTLGLPCHDPSLAMRCFAEDAVVLEPDIAMASNEVLAGLPLCPPGLGVQEYAAFLQLFGRENRLWPTFLVELGSANLNLSAVASMQLVKSLCCRIGSLQAGKYSSQEFMDEDNFGLRLGLQLSKRLVVLEHNWRDVLAMESILTLILRLCSSRSHNVINTAMALLKDVRRITLGWVRMLRHELDKIANDSLVKELTLHATMAALLCRRTFFVFHGIPSASKQANNEILRSDEILPFEKMVDYVEASISLQEHTPADPRLTEPILRSMLVRDLIGAKRLDLAQSLDEHPRAILEATARMGIFSHDGHSELSFTTESDGVWAHIQLVPVPLPTSGSPSRDVIRISFNVILGHLLINGAPAMTELPAEYRSHWLLAELFPGLRLKVALSSAPGMTYRIRSANDHSSTAVHIGFRQGHLIVRRASNGVLDEEIVPRGVFRQGVSNSDLPADLLHDHCIHVMHLLRASKPIEIRRRSSGRFQSRETNWFVYWDTRHDSNRVAKRGNGTVLVDTRSKLSDMISKIFAGFEEPEWITIYQQQRSSWSVELRRYDLRFFVNRNGFLESSQLRAEIDPNQDCGTFYGLFSKLVLRDTCNPRQRSVIVPLGNAQSIKTMLHVKVTIKPSEGFPYGRFFIDETLGQLTCAPEPRLIYSKALLHAYTSLYTPDILTKKTGTEEALWILGRGGSQPWAALTQVPISVLDQMADLTPIRGFYPAGLHVMETVAWSANHNVCMQDERFAPLVRDIKHKSEALAVFEGKIADSAILEAKREASEEELTLLWRAEHRRQRLRRPHFQECLDSQLPDLLYSPRGLSGYEQPAARAYEPAFVLHRWPDLLPFPCIPLSLTFQTFPYIGGYVNRPYVKLRLSDHIQVDLGSSWGDLVTLARQTQYRDRFSMLFLLATLAFSAENMNAIRVLLAICRLDDLKNLELPPFPSYTQYRSGQVPTIKYVKDLIKGCVQPFSSDATPGSQKQRKALDRARREQEAKANSDIEELSAFFCKQFPTMEPNLDGFQSNVLNLEQALALVKPEFFRMYTFHLFEQHLRDVQNILDKHRNPEKPFQTFQIPLRRVSVRPPRAPSIIQGNLLAKEIIPFGTPATVQRFPYRFRPRSESSSCTVDDLKELRAIADGLPQLDSLIRAQYKSDLISSIEALESVRSGEASTAVFLDVQDLSARIRLAQQDVVRRLDILVAQLRDSDRASSWLTLGGLFPISTATALLTQLRSTSRLQLGRNVRSGILELGLSIVQLQRLLRIEDAYHRKHSQRLELELLNEGHTNWDPHKSPDWLLFEVEANIMVRPIQAVVAREIVAPASSGGNSLLQLNMGEGKTSTIIPLAVLILANRKSLCRVIVPKSLLLQTAQLLQSRLGGILERQVRHVSFNRRTVATEPMIEQYQALHEDIRRKAGIVLVLPEHLMSFILSGQQKLLDHKYEEGRRMIKVQNWLNKVARDVIDESDAILAAKTQLIYPSGPQNTVDGGKYRWLTIEAVLAMVEAHIDMIQQRLPSSVEVVRRPQGFPFIFFTHSAAENLLLQSLVNDVCSGRAFQFSLSMEETAELRKYLTLPKPSKVTAQCMHIINARDHRLGVAIYLLRGLFVHRILLLTLKRRWNVQYGVHPHRDPIAVPFLAKGVPSDLAEWGHADVAITFTILSHYFQGVSKLQFRQSLEHLIKSDEPSREYDQWIEGSRHSMSGRCMDLTQINIDDLSVMEEVWKAVRMQTSCINYFLNYFVFPKHAKQFSRKIQVSGWDIPLSSTGTTITTGFSGTTDSSYLLPLTISQQNLKSLTHTNAEVLAYLLQPRNRQYELAANNSWVDGKLVRNRLPETDFLKRISHLGIKVLIDAGAMVLEMTNRELVLTWLQIVYNAPAAVYFNDSNRAMTLYKDGRTMPLASSPFAEQLENCLVYLDEAHCRGTDLKFPATTRAALTLSLNQTKDTTIQAAMRLRQLGTTQSITFFATPETHQSIIDSRYKKWDDYIDSKDVIHWLLEKTCESLENLMPLYYNQGTDYCRRKQIALDHPNLLRSDTEMMAFAEKLQDTEAQTLRALYDPQHNVRRGRQVRVDGYTGVLQKYMKDLEARRCAFRDTGQAVHASALQEVEQEREAQVEAETVREIHKPLKFWPHAFSGLQDDILNFVKSGSLPEDSPSCGQLWLYLRRTGTGRACPISLPETAQIFVTLEFTKTVVIPSGKPNDDFLRPVQWLLWSRLTEAALLVSPEEVEELIPFCRESQHTHLLSYAAPVTRRMIQFNNLDYYTIPPLPNNYSMPLWLRVQVGLFAGKLYFPFEEYKLIRELLGVQNELTDGKEATEVEGPTRSLVDPLKAAKVLTWLQRWMQVRNKNSDLTHTPMGYIIANKPLHPDHGFFQQPHDIIRDGGAGAGGAFGQEQVEKEDDVSDMGDDIDEEQRLTVEELAEKPDADATEWMEKDADRDAHELEQDDDEEGESS